MPTASPTPWTPSSSSWPGAPSRRPTAPALGPRAPRSGRHLMVHFQTIVVGHFPDLRLHPYKGRSVTHVHDDAMVQDDASRAAAAAAGLPWIRGGLVEHAGGGHMILEAHHTPWGRHHAETMRDSNMGNRMWAFIMQGEDLPYPTNTIDLSPSIKDARGLPVARMTYQPGRTSWRPQSITARSSSRCSRRWARPGPSIPPHQACPTARSRPRRSPRADTSSARRGWATIRRRPWSIAGAHPHAGQRGGGRLVGLRDLDRLRADADPGGAGGAAAHHLARHAAGRQSVGQAGAARRPAGADTAGGSRSR